MSVPLTPCATEAREWQIRGDWESRSHRYDATVPGVIADLGVAPPRPIAVQCGEAAVELTVLDRTPAASNAAAAAALILAEALASSLLEAHILDPLALARAEAGQPTTASARAVTAGAGALAAHLDAASRAMSLGALASAHSRPRRLASGAVRVRPYRSEQVWEGGTDLWPRGAAYVPPHPERIAEAMDDVVVFAGRDDMDPIAQAAIVHAQLATIRPFGDGDNRVADAAINGVLRRRGVASRVIAPVAVVLASRRMRHQEALAAYRGGDAEPIIALVAQALTLSAHTTAQQLPDLVELPTHWGEVARPRAGSAAASLIELLAAHPLVDASEVRRLTGASQASAYTAIERLSEAGVLTRISPTRRKTVWAALDVFAFSVQLARVLSSGASASTSRRRPSTRAVA